MRIYPTQTVDQEFATLGTAGYTGTLNDRQFTYLRASGYTGALPDMMNQFASFSPLNLFLAGETGGWYDPSDLTSMFQDDAATVPVTAAGQSVAVIRDKSGRGNHAAQTTAASRPLYQVDAGGRGHLVFDGVDDFLLTPTVTPGGSVGQVFAGARKASDAATAYLLDSTSNMTAQNGGIALLAPPTAAATWRLQSKGTIQVSATTAATYAAPVTSILTGLASTVAPSAELRVDGVSKATTVTSQGTGGYLAYGMRIGRRAGTVNPFNGSLYGLIVRFGAALTSDQITATERWLGQKSGVTI